MKRILFYTILIISISIPKLGMAAQIRLVPGEIPAKVGQSVGIIVAVDTVETSANAFELDLSFDPTTLSYTDSEDAAAVTTFWITYPHLCGNTSVCMSGITPGGFKGANQQLATLYFTPLQTGTTTLVVKNARLLAHDGKGTALPIDFETLQFVIEPATDSSVIPPSRSDTEPPEPFTPQVVLEDREGKETAVLIFSTKDKQSSVVAYYVKEYTIPFIRWFTPWTRADSPYVLKDQSRQSIIAVKAVDRNGNERYSYLYGDQSISEMLLPVATLFSVLLVIGLLYLMKSHRRPPLN